MSKKLKSIENYLIEKYFNLLDQHINEVINGEVEEFYEINQIASKLNISHSHFSEVVKQITGKHPCYFYDLKIIDQAKILLQDKNLSIAKVAQMLTYDASNFSKFFKKFVGVTPGAYRKSLNI